METLIRRSILCRRMWRLIWVCTICQLPFWGSPDYNGLIWNFADVLDIFWTNVCDLDTFRAWGKESILVKYPYVLSKYSIIFKTLGIDTQLFLQSTQLHVFPNWRVKIKFSRPGKPMITTLNFIFWLLQIIGVFTVFFIWQILSNE